MSPKGLLVVALRQLRNRWQFALLLAASVLLVVAGIFVSQSHNEPLHLRSCLSYGRSTPGPLAKLLQEEAAKRGLAIDFVSATGSEATLVALEAGELDVAPIRAGVARERPGIRQIAAGNCEVLHVFARGGIRTLTPSELLGKRVAIGRPGTEARTIAESVLSFMELRPGADFQVVELQSDECAALPINELPDVVFDVSSLPSSCGEVLARRCGYHLLDLPLGEALRLRDHAFEDVVVPACTYDVSPAVPAEAIHTVGCRVVLVARRDASEVAVKELLAIIFEGDFARRAGMPPLSADRVAETLDCPLHAGAIAYLNRDRPLIRADTLENLEGLQGVLGTATCGILLAWGWYRRMGAPGIDRYPQLLAELELQAMRLGSKQGLGSSEFRRLWQELAALREEVLGHVASRRLAADEKLSELLQRFVMVEQSLERLNQRHPASSGETASRRAA